MLKDVIDNRNIEIATLNLFKEVKGLCDFIGQTKDDGTVQTFPAIYTGKDSYKFVTQYDFRSGVLFHVQTESTNIEVLLEQGLRANNDLLRMTYPMQCIAIVGKSKINDTAYTPEEIGLNIIHKLRGNINSLRTTLNLNAINVEVGTINTDSKEIDNIFQNVELKFRHDLALVVIDYNVILDGYDNCFETYTC
jgi:hypothetical protein